MTVYARSDIMSVSLSKDHGGCGATHSRPVTQGSPNKVWALNCHPCEDHLRSDPKWASDAVEIPETPDEEKLREAGEKRGEHAQKVNLETAVASLATTAEGFQKLMAMMFASNPEMAENMNKMLAAVAMAPVVGTEVMAKAAERETLGAAGLDGVNAMRVEAGLQPFTEPATAVQDAPTEKDGLAVLKVAGSTPGDVATLKVADLRALARDRGLDSTGTRDQLIARLTDAG